MTSSPNQTIICHEIFDENSQPSEEEILDYAVKIGIDPKSEPHLIPIARDGLMHALPSEWKPCFDSSLQRWYYFNSKTGDSQWEHPLDPVYRDIVRRGRSEGYSSAGDDDSKTTAKEDLKSFEEVSDMLSSKSNDLRSAKQTGGDKLKGSVFGTPQPLLARRKQLQQGHDPLKPTPLQTAKLVNSTLRDGLHEFSGNEWLKGKSGVGATQLRRAHTLDPIPDSSGPRSGPPVKGILRDTSFPGAPPRSLARLDPMPGEYSIGMSDMEDEKKRSVRFADFELKALDIKFHVSDSEESIFGVEDADDGSGSSFSPEDGTSERASPEGNLQIEMEGNRKPFTVTNRVRAAPIKNVILQRSSPPEKHDKKLTKSRSLSPFKTDRGSFLESEMESKHKTSSAVSRMENKSINNVPVHFDRNSDEDLYNESGGNSENEREVNKTTPNKKNNLTEVSCNPRPEIKLSEKASEENKSTKSKDFEQKTQKPDVTLASEKKSSSHQNFSTSSFLTTNTHSNPDIAGEGPNNNLGKEALAEPPVPKEKISPKVAHFKKSTSLISFEMPIEEMEEIAKKKASEKLAVFQDRLTKDIQDKIAALKQQQSQNLFGAKESIKKEETNEMLKFKKEMEKRLKEFTISIEKEYKQREEELKAKFEKSLQDLVTSLEAEEQKKMAEIKAKMESDFQEKIQFEEKRFANEKLKIETETNQRIQKSTEMTQTRVSEIKSKEEAEIAEIKSKSIGIIEELKKKYGEIIDELEEKHKNEIKKVEEDHNASTQNLQMEKTMELKRIETEWEDKITATVLQHKTTLETAVLDHEKTITNLRHQFQKEEDEIKRKHAEQIEAWNIRVKKVTNKEPYDVAQINRDFEKMRCEKRLLEDKYRSLKDKYVQLKSDMRVAVERKLQSRAKRKKEESKNVERTEGKTIDVDSKPVGEPKVRNGKLLNNNYTEPEQMSDRALTVPADSSRSPFAKNLHNHNIKEALLENITDNDPSSTDEPYNSLSSAPPTESEPKSISKSETAHRYPKHMRPKLSKHKDSSGNVLDNVRTQLQELEEIEEKIPATAHKDTYVRYPFLGPGLGTSAEVDFYRHRVLVEQEAVRAARECLLQQKRELEARQNVLRANTNNTTLSNLQQQEQDLTEMEVSIHRTRALLGEKMIRLRLLGQTLDRLVQEPPSPLHTTAQNTTGVATVGTEAGNFQTNKTACNVLENLESINSEIREIWAHLSKKNTFGLPQRDNGGGADIEALVSPTRHHSSSERRALESRLNALKQWLDKPPQLNNGWTQLTL